MSQTRATPFANNASDSIQLYHEFCENGAKAVCWEATKKRATPEIFSIHTVTELLDWSDHKIENLGRLTHLMAYDPVSDTYRAISP